MVYSTDTLHCGCPAIGHGTLLIVRTLILITFAGECFTFAKVKKSPVNTGNISHVDTGVRDIVNGLPN